MGDGTLDIDQLVRERLHDAVRVRPRRHENGRLTVDQAFAQKPCHDPVETAVAAVELHGMVMGVADRFLGLPAHRAPKPA